MHFAIGSLDDLDFRDTRQAIVDQSAEILDGGGLPILLRPAADLSRSLVTIRLPKRTDGSSDGADRTEQFKKALLLFVRYHSKQQVAFRCWCHSAAEWAVIDY